MQLTNLTNALLVCEDVPRQRAFYEALGWHASAHAVDGFVPFTLGGVTLILWDRAAAVAELGELERDGLVLDLCVPRREDVEPALAAAEAAGGRVVVDAVERPFGFSGFFVDRAGTPWQVAWIDAEPPFFGPPAGPSESPLPERLDAITLTTPDVLAQRDLLEALGWSCPTQRRDDVAQLQHGGGILSAWVAHEAAEEIAAPLEAAGHRFGGFTLAIAVDSPTAVDEAFAIARAAGAPEIVAPADRWWGGRSGYYADPEGNPWEIVWIPSAERDAAGALVVGAI